ncbi:uncharacterized protein LOC112346621 [Selaginella moellendorffii]|uniref:uncharacterized protein LOC112346621 n=1 Tax=Selaginella moellendorffii TaxID=88036 RepID=UPI000D1C2D78|nr:uncharacterized protein LOC112346621 [Selaginella moellendorffii]|eukprot:XP_024531777.1 uncharacterized protein LOC112346621 [Selaginella moellendorffii]
MEKFKSMDFSATAHELFESAKEAKEKSEEAIKAGVKNSQDKVKEVAELVLDEAHKAAGSAKEFVKGAVHRVEGYADNFKTGSSEIKGNLKDNLSQALDQNKGNFTMETLGSYPMAMVNWCSNACGSSKNHYKDMADDVTEVLKESATKLEHETAAATSSKTD